MSTHSQLDEILSLVWYVTFPKRYSINDCILSKPVKAVTYFILKGGLLWKQKHMKIFVSVLPATYE